MGKKGDASEYINSELKSDVGNNELLFTNLKGIQKKVYHYVLDNPGCTSMMAARDLKLPSKYIASILRGLKGLDLVRSVGNAVNRNSYSRQPVLTWEVV